MAPSILSDMLHVTNGHNAHSNGRTTSHVNGSTLKRHHEHGFGTRAIHAGSEPDAVTGAVIPSISLSTTYKQDGVGVHKVSRGSSLSGIFTPPNVFKC
jgi:hypothetical protein